MAIRSFYDFFSKNSSLLEKNFPVGDENFPFLTLSSFYHLFVRSKVGSMSEGADKGFSLYINDLYCAVRAWVWVSD